MEVASYYVGVKFRFDQKEIQKLDQHLLKLEKKFKAYAERLNKSLALNITQFKVNKNLLKVAVSQALKEVSALPSTTLRINKFRVDQAKLRSAVRTAIRGTGQNKDVQNKTVETGAVRISQPMLNKGIQAALQNASDKVVFEVSKFAVNERNLRAALMRAQQSLGNMGSTGGIGQRGTLSSGEWDRREAEKQRLWWERREALREDEARRTAERMARRPQGSSSFADNRSMAFGGGVAGTAARMYAPALALGFGGYGLAQTNKMNQEVISAQLTTQAVTEAAGLKGQGPEAFEWLRSQGNRIGFSYMDMAQDYNNFLSNSLGAGVSLEGSQDIFQGFSEYSRAMGITPARNKLVMNALSQMIGKGTLSMEELKRQMAESMPGTMDVFGQAYAEMTKSGLSGQQAMEALYEAVPTGKVRSAEILPIVQRILRERAAPKLDVAMKTSQAEQARFRNMTADKAIFASNNGLESGFSRLFRALTEGLAEADPMVKALARGFDDVTKGVGSALLLVQSFQRFFQGRDSMIGDLLFPSEEKRKAAFEWLESMKGFLGEMNQLVDTSYRGWLQLLNLLDGSAILKKLTNALNTVTNGIGVINDIANGDTEKAKDKAKAFAYGYIETITAPGRTGANALLSAGTGALSAIDPRITDKSGVVAPRFDIEQFRPYNPAQEVARYKAEQAMMANTAMNQYALPGINQPLAQGQNSVDLKLQMNVDIRAANPEDFNQQFQDKFSSIIQNTLLQYSEKE